MLLALTVLAIDHVQRLVHLLHLLGCTDLQGVLHHRLLGTTAASKGALQGGIGEPPRLDLDQAMGSCQHTDQGVGEFVGRALLTRLLRNVQRVLNRLKHLQRSELDADGRQAGTTAKLLGGRCARFGHDDASPLVQFSLYERDDSSSFFWQAPFLGLSATTLGQI